MKRDAFLIKCFAHHKQAVGWSDFYYDYCYYYCSSREGGTGTAKGGMALALLMAHFDI